MFSAILEAIGFALVVAAAYLVALPLALLTAGIGLILAANLIAARRAKPGETGS